MGLLDIFRTLQLRWRQHRLVEDLIRGGIEYSGGNGETAEDHVVIRGAPYDLVGTAAEFGWLIRRFGTMNVDWRIRYPDAGQWATLYRTNVERPALFHAIR